jgi:imidazolonepropionase-like amidohydrolase
MGADEEETHERLKGHLGELINPKIAERTHAIDRHRWNEVTDGAVLQEDGTIVELGTYQELSRKHPNVAVVGSGNEVMLPGFVNGHHHIGLTPVLAPMWLARSKRWAREYWTSRPATKSMAAPAHPTDCRSPINSNSTPTFWLSSRAEPGNQHRRIFDAVARTASSLKRDRRFADSPLEGDGFELSVPGQRRHPSPTAG